MAGENSFGIRVAIEEAQRLLRLFLSNGGVGGGDGGGLCRGTRDES